MSGAQISDEARAKLSEAITAVFNEDVESCVVVKWSLVVETLDADGDRGLWTLAPPGQKAWDTMGLLSFALGVEQASIHHHCGGD